MAVILLLCTKKKKKVDNVRDVIVQYYAVIRVWKCDYQKKMAQGEKE